LVPLAALGLDDGIPILVPVLAPVLQPPEHQRSQGAEDGKGTGNHFPSPYLRENWAMKSTIFWSVRSGSSPGINVATAMAAPSTVAKTPM
jgi:hypothetical protein